MKRMSVAWAVAALALLSFFFFPGRTWLHQDTQIYVPILEHLFDPQALGGEMLVQRPHVTFTVFDETALWLRRAAGLGFHETLTGQQIVLRALGIWGIYLMATAMGVATGPALLVASIFSLGATIPGPSVLSVEYEPVPRGFAVPLLLAATGLAAHGRDLAAGIAGAAAFLVHPPTVYPFWGVYFLLALWPSKPEIMRRRDLAFIPLVAAALMLLVASRYQAGEGETQNFFLTLTPLQEHLQRMRTSYVYVSTWLGTNWSHYLALSAILAALYWRLRRQAPPDLGFLLVGMPLVGLLSVPLSYYLLEIRKWALLPQFQPMRALLFVAVVAGFLASVAGTRARRWWVALVGFAIAYALPVNTRLLEWPSARRLAVVLLLAALAALAMRRRWALPVAVVAPFFLIPTLGGVRTYPQVHTPELTRLSQWARGSTPRGSVFLFPSFGRGPDAGVFRAQALRAVYVDWKGGGQVNYLRELGEQWWDRWQKAMTRPLPFEEYGRLGIDYVVLSPRNRPAGARPVFENQRYAVYQTRPGAA